MEDDKDGIAVSHNGTENHEESTHHDIEDNKDDIAVSHESTEDYEQDPNNGINNHEENNTLDDIEDSKDNIVLSHAVFGNNEDEHDDNIIEDGEEDIEVSPDIIEPNAYEEVRIKVYCYNYWTWLKVWWLDINQIISYFFLLLRDPNAVDLIWIRNTEKNVNVFGSKDWIRKCVKNGSGSKTLHSFMIECLSITAGCSVNIAHQYWYLWRRMKRSRVGAKYNCWLLS